MVVKNAALNLSLLCTSVSIACHAGDDPFNVFGVNEQPMEFVTPALMSSNATQSPISVTSLSAEDLNLLGIVNVVDAMRLVPGMLVADEYGSGSTISYHGTNVNVPRRMEILFNGNSVYRPGYAGINWHRLPFDVPDLSSIEVLRGTSVVDFGSNAFRATVNFVQAPTQTAPTASLQSFVGEGVYNAWVSGKVEIGNGHVLLRYQREDDEGYDTSNISEDLDDTYTGDSLLLSGQFDVGANRILDFSATFSEYEYEYPGFQREEIDNVFALADSIARQPDPTKEDNINLVVKLSGNSRLSGMATDWSLAANYVYFSRETELRSCQPAYVFDPLLAALDDSPNIHLVDSDFELMFNSGFSTGNVQIRDSIVNPLNENDFALLRAVGMRMLEQGPDPSYATICSRSDANVDEQRYGINGRATLQVSDDLTVTSALNLNRAKATSMTYLQGDASRYTGNMSASVRYAYSSDTLFNVGVMFEDDDFNDLAVSYRATVNHQVLDGHHVRLGHAVSKRLPDIYETERVWQFYHRFEPGFVDYLGQTEAGYFRTSRSPESLDEEKNETFELGYTYRSEFGRFEIDAKLFHERFTNMISEGFNYFDFDLTNNGRTTLKGFETGSMWRGEHHKIGLSYTYIDNESTNAFDRTLYSRHTGAVWSIIDLSPKLYLGLTVTGNSDIGNHSHVRGDAALTYLPNWYNTDVQIQVVFRRYPSQFSAFTEFSSITPNVVAFDDRNQGFLNLAVSF